MAREQQMSGLRVSAADAKKEIQKAIRKGRSLPGYGDDDIYEIDEADRKHDQWVEVTKCMLVSIFDSDVEIARFDDAFPAAGTDAEDDDEYAERLGEGIDAQVASLVTVRDSLPYYRPSKTGQRAPASAPRDSRKVFVVHGHDEDALHDVEQFIRSLKLDPVVLYKQANRGKTVIEKFEKHSDVGFAVVLLTPDDYAYSKKAPKKVEERPRPNVILELGYVLAKLGRERVCALKKGDIATPSDIHGVIWVEMDEKGKWRKQLGREMKAADMPVDTRKAR